MDINLDLIQGYKYTKNKENLESIRVIEGLNTMDSYQNPYANTYIQFSTGEICYVTDIGFVRKMTAAAYKYNPGQQGCPGSDQLKQIDMPWSSDYDTIGTVISSSPPLVVGQPMDVQESCSSGKGSGSGSLNPNNIINSTTNSQIQQLLNETSSLQDQYDELLIQYRQKVEEYSQLQQTINNQASTYVKSSTNANSNTNKNYYVNKVISGDVSYNYVGCYTDSSSSPALPSLLDGGSIYTASQCANAAVQDGASYFGLQNFDPSSNTASCYYGTNKTAAEQYGVAPNSVCAQGSDGNAYGSSNTIAIYETPSSLYYGAYNDQPAPSRAMNQVGTSSTYTYDSCLKSAQDASSSYFGLQGYSNGGSQCYISSDFSGATQYGTSTNVFTGTDGHTYGNLWTNAIYVVSPNMATYMGCYNYRPVNSSLIPCPSSVTNYTQCQTYAIQNGYKYFGIQGYNSGVASSANYFVINDLAGATQYGKNPCAVSTSDNNTYGLSGVNALYSLPSLNSSLVGKVGYVDTSSNLYSYPSSSLGLSNAYTFFQGFVSKSTAFLGSVFTGGSLSQCDASCNASNKCYGYQYSSSTNSCQLLNDQVYPKTPITPSSTTDLYVRNPSILKAPQGVSSNITYVDSVFYSQFKDTGKLVDNEYNFAKTLNQDNPQLTDMEQQLSLMTQSLENMREKIQNNMTKLNNQSVSDYNGTGEYLKEYGEISGKIQNNNMVNSNLDRMILNNEIILNQKRTVYIIWLIIAILAFGIIFYIMYRFTGSGTSSSGVSPGTSSTIT